MRKSLRQRAITCRGYTARRAEGEYVSVCLRPFLVTQGRTDGESLHQMQQLIDGYIDDAAQEGRLDAVLGRRAPARYWVEYVRGLLLVSALHILRTSFKPFTRACCHPQHA
jgi:predicted RNase H-like HicB family nuclease